MSILGFFRETEVKEVLKMRKFKAFSSEIRTMFIEKPLDSVMARLFLDV